jgi:hypothetical protein
MSEWTALPPLPSQWVTDPRSSSLRSYINWKQSTVSWMCIYHHLLISLRKQHALVEDSGPRTSYRRKLRHTQAQKRWEVALATVTPLPIRSNCNHDIHIRESLQMLGIMTVAMVFKSSGDWNIRILIQLYGMNQVSLLRLHIIVFKYWQ